MHPWGRDQPKQAVGQGASRDLSSLSVLPSPPLSTGCPYGKLLCPKLSCSLSFKTSATESLLSKTQKDGSLPMWKETLKKHLFPCLAGIAQNLTSTGDGQCFLLSIFCSVIYILKAAVWSALKTTSQRTSRSCLFNFANTLKINASVALRRNIFIFFSFKLIFILNCFILHLIETKYSK